MAWGPDVSYTGDAHPQFSKGEEVVIRHMMITCHCKFDTPGVEGYQTLLSRWTSLLLDLFIEQFLPHFWESSGIKKLFLSFRSC